MSKNMFTIINLIFVATLLLSSTVKANLTRPPVILPRVIYGIDDRVEVFESSDSILKEMSHSIAAKMLDSHFDSIENNVYVLGRKTLQDEGICSYERYAKQLSLADCSGFLISPDTLVTAGHCIRDVDECSRHYWVFDYANYTEEKSGYIFKENQVYRCNKIVSRLEEEEGVDYAVIKLDRKVYGRTPLKIRRIGKVSDDAVLTVLGFPSGIPLKITTGAVIRDNNQDGFFVMNSDTYSGNSGSPVVDTRTGLVEGILVRGDTDYKMSQIKEDNGCVISAVRDQNGSRGEDATRITKIKTR